MSSRDERAIKSYLSRIGSAGGKKSRRKLGRDEAREMVRVREAKRAYRDHYIECFWSFDPELQITKDDVKWVAEQLMKNGSRATWEVGRKLCP